MILPADHVLRAVINARLLVPLLLLVCFWSYLFHAVMLPYQVGNVPLTCVDVVDYVSGIHVASSNCWTWVCLHLYLAADHRKVSSGGGSSSAAAPKVSAPEVSAAAEVEPENVVPEDTYLDLTGPDEVVATQPGKSKRKADIQAHVVQRSKHGGIIELTTYVSSEANFEQVEHRLSGYKQFCDLVDQGTVVNVAAAASHLVASVEACSADRLKSEKRFE
ncbi:hypothetical protein Tco_0987875 [Tanacetum coccineum]